MENTFGKYRIAAPISASSSNPAYHARSINATEWSCVVKVYNDRKLRSPIVQEEWQHKMAALMDLKHPHILPTIDIGIEEDVPYSVTTYMERGSLRDRLNQISPEQLAVQDVKNIVLQVGQALQYTHERHILHGNLKPENILFDEHDNALLADFCLPQHPDETDPGLPIVAPLTPEPGEDGDDSGKLSLTYYPAQESLSEKSDQYALGFLAYELLAGRLQTAKLPSVRLLPRKSLTVASPSDQVWIRQVETVLSKAMEEEPDARYENVAAFLAEFEQVCSSPSLVDPTQEATQAMPLGAGPAVMPAYINNATWQLPAPRPAKTYWWQRSHLLMQMYQTYRENVVWRTTAIVVPLLLLVTFCILLISRFSSSSSSPSSQHSWQAVVTPTLQTTNSNNTVVSVTSQSEGLVLKQQTSTPTPTTYATAAPPSLSQPVSLPTPTAIATSSGSGSHKSHKSSHSNSSSSNSSSSNSSSSKSSSHSSPTPTPTSRPAPTPTPPRIPKNPFKQPKPHCLWFFGCSRFGRGGRGW